MKGFLTTKIRKKLNIMKPKFLQKMWFILKRLHQSAVSAETQISEVLLEAG